MTSRTLALLETGFGLWQAVPCCASVKRAGDTADASRVAHSVTMPASPRALSSRPRDLFDGAAMQKPPLDPDVADLAPTSPALTGYDEQHLVTYLRLLDAAEDGADWRGGRRDRAAYRSRARAGPGAPRVGDPSSPGPLDDRARLSAFAPRWRASLTARHKALLIRAILSSP
jgi:hypothetical protein